jgi:thiol:disulfide interchange protein/DsbC/DsbD-like thiol-disulfide interchange protein
MLCKINYNSQFLYKMALSMKHFYTTFFILLITALQLNLAGAQNTPSSKRVENVVATLVTSHDSFTESDALRVGIRLDMDPHWHVYYINPGDSGLAPEANWQLPKGMSVGAFEFPTPEIIPIEPLTNYGYEHSVTLLAPAKISKDLKTGTHTLSAEVSWLMCKDICLPGEAMLTIPITFNAKDGASKQSEAAARFPSTEEYPAPDSGLIADSLIQTDTSILFPISDPAFTKTLRFIPLAEGIIDDSALQTFVNLEDGRMALQVTKDSHLSPEIKTIEGLFLTYDKGIIVQSEKVTRALSAAQQEAIVLGVQESTDHSSFFKTPTQELTFKLSLLFAFLGGLILNLMPCVLPVLALKVFSLIKHAGSGKAFLHGLTFSFGVILTMVSLGGLMIFLTQAGQIIGWGFQLQNPYFVLILSLLIFLLSLSMFGTFSLGDSLTRIGEKPETKHGFKNTFLSGILMVMVATPCTAPFMGTAMGFAFTLTPEKTIAIFAALGAGLAFPYMFLTLFPPLIKAMPKPGAWMLTFKQFLAFPMLATALWLLWVFTSLTSTIASFTTILVLLATFFFAWCYGKLMTLSAGLVRKLIALLFMLAAIGTFMGYGLNSVEGSPLYQKFWAPEKAIKDETSHAHKQWRTWTEEEFYASLQNGEAVFVNMTADWCITCKVNERTTLKNKHILELFDKHDITLYKGDWTRFNPGITKILETYGRKGVPLYLYFPKGQKDAIILPQILTPAIIREIFE